MVADVSCAILGIDFLSHFRLQVDIAARRITDKSTSLSVNGIIDHAPVSPSVSLPRSDDESISLILAEFPTLTNVSGNLRAPVKHTVQHHIETTGTPVHASVRRLAPDRLKIAKREFDHMLELGIVRPSSSPYASPSTWSPRRPVIGDHAVTTVD